MTTKPVPAGCGQHRWPERRVNWPDTVPFQPQAGEASSDLLEDDEATQRRFRIAARFWTLYLAALLVAVCYGIAHFLPALKTLAN